MFIKLTRPFNNDAVFVRVSSLHLVGVSTILDYSVEPPTEVAGSYILVGNDPDDFQVLETPQQIFALIEAATVSGQFVQGASLGSVPTNDGAR